MSALRSLWGMPILLGMLTAVGLGAPVAVGAWHVFKPVARRQ
jgi:hypothetical protein